MIIIEGFIFDTNDDYSESKINPNLGLIEKSGPYIESFHNISNRDSDKCLMVTTSELFVK